MLVCAFDTVLEMNRTYLVLICSLLISYIREAESETHSLRKALKTKKVRDCKYNAFSDYHYNRISFRKYHRERKKQYNK